MEITTVLDTSEARKNFLIGLVFVAKADGVVDQREAVFFRNTAIALGLDDSAIKDIDLCWSQISCPPLRFSTSMQKKLFLREAIQLCCIDDNYHDNEKALVRYFSSELGVSQETLSALEHWVQRGLAWKDEGDKLIQSEG